MRQWPCPKTGSIMTYNFLKQNNRKHFYFLAISLRYLHAYVWQKHEKFNAFWRRKSKKNVKFLPCPYYIFLSSVFRQNWFAIPITLIFCVSLLVRKFIAIDLWQGFDRKVIYSIVDWFFKKIKYSILKRLILSSHHFIVLLCFELKVGME